MDADIQILLGNVEAVAREHQLARGRASSIADVGSATGTFLNGENVEGECPCATETRSASARRG